MKKGKTLYSKFILGYLLFGLLGFVAIATLGSSLCQRYELSRQRDVLYQEANSIASSYRSVYNGSESNFSEVRLQLQDVARCMNSEIWIMDSEGNILFNTAREISEPAATDFDPIDSGSNYYMTGDFYGVFSEPQLSVYCQLISSYHTSGYVLLHYPMSEISAARDSVMNIVYLMGLLIFALSFVILIFLHFVVYNPLRKINRAANEYAAGNLTYDPEVHTHDEMGYLAATLKYMASELNNTGESQKKFVANVSHDFRSPLTSIKGYIEAIQDGTIPPQMQEKYLGIVLDETNRLTKLTQDLLTLNTFDSRGIYLNYTDFDINHIVKKTIASFEVLCSQKGITFDLTTSARELIVRADQDKIQQVLYNLIDNAIKFSSSNSVISISTTDRYGKVFVSVKDTGAGIPKDSLNKVFDRFFKTDPSRGKDKKGTGLGLSITKEIILAHNQTIDVISTEGVGSEFIFTLQLANQKESKKSG